MILATLPLSTQETKHVSDSAIIKRFVNKFPGTTGVLKDTLYVKFKLNYNREDIYYKGLTDTCLIKFEPGDTTKYYTYYKNSLKHKNHKEVKKKHFDSQNYLIINKDETLSDNSYSFIMEFHITRYEGDFMTDFSFGALTVSYTYVKHGHPLKSIPFPDKEDKE